MVRSLYKLVIFLTMVFLLYLLLVKSVIIWVQQSPNHFFNFVEDATSSVIKVDYVEVEQSWLSIAVKIKSFDLENNNLKINIKKLAFDFNLLSLWLPKIKYGKQINILGVNLELKDSLFIGSKQEFDEYDLINKHLKKNWHLITLTNFNIKANFEQKINLNIKTFKSFYDKKWAFSGLSELIINDGEKSELQYKGSFSSNVFSAIEDGKASFSIVKPINLNSLYVFLPKKMSKKLPKGDLVGNIDFKVTDGHLSAFRIDTNSQDLIWDKHNKSLKHKSLPKNIGFSLKLIPQSVTNIWLFEIEKISLNSSLVETISPIFLLYENDQKINISAERFDIVSIKPVFDTMVKRFDYVGFGKNIKKLTLKNFRGTFNLQEANLEDLSFQVPSFNLPQNEKLPGIKFKDFFFNKKGSAITVTVEQGISLYLDYISPKPIKFISADPYKFTRNYVKNNWQMEKTSLLVDKMPLTLEAKGNFIGYLDLKLDVQPKNIAKVKKYLPYSFMSKGFEIWLKGALVSGNNIKGSLHLKGDMNNFPFQNSSGIFYAEATADNVELKFQPDWPAIKAPSAKLVFSPFNLSITTPKARLKRANVSNIVVNVFNLDSSNIAIDISGKVTSSAANGIEFLKATPLLKQIEMDEFIKNELALSGNLRVDLNKIWIPVYGFDDRSEEVKGEVFFKKVNLTLFKKLKINNLAGRIKFTEKSVKSVKKITGKFQQAKAVYELDTINEVIHIKGAGIAEIDNTYLSGKHAWQAKILIPLEKNNPIDISAEASFKDSVSKLPAPLDNLQTLNYPKLRVNLKIASNVNLLNIKLSDQFVTNIKLDKDFKQVHGFEFIGAEKNVQSTKKSITNNYKVHGKIKNIDLDGWIKLMPDLDGEESFYDVTKWQPSELQVETLKVLGQKLKAINLNLYPVNIKDITDIVFSVNSDEVSLLASFNNDKYVVRLDKLNLDKIGNFHTSSSRRCAPLKITTKIPQIKFIGKNIVLGKKTISTLNFDIKNDGKKIMANNIYIGLGEEIGNIQGQYIYHKNDLMSLLNVNIKSKDIKYILAFLEIKKGLNGKKLKVSANIKWRGFINCFSKIKIAGDLKFHLKKGVIKNAEPGMARILGLLSLDALARRLSLDVSDITKAGLSFDSIKGYGRFNKGIFGLEKLRLKAPAAEAKVFGELNLVQEDMDLNAEITPAIGSTLPIIAAISGFATPIAGLSAYLLLKVIPGINKDLITYNYKITGSFVDPKIKNKGVGLNLLKTE